MQAPEVVTLNAALWPLGWIEFSYGRNQGECDPWPRLRQVMTENGAGLGGAKGRERSWGTLSCTYKPLLLGEARPEVGCGGPLALMAK